MKVKVDWRYVDICIYYFWLFKIDPDFFQNEEFPKSSYLAKQLMWIYGR